MDERKEELTKENAEDASNCLSKILVWYVVPLLNTGFRRKLQKQDVDRVSKNNESEVLCLALETKWEEELSKAAKLSRKPKLHNAIYATFSREYWFYGICWFFKQIFHLIQFIFMSRIIRYFQRCSEISQMHVYLYAMGFSFATIATVVARHRPFHCIMRVGMRIRVACSALIYKKSLKLHNSALRETEVGKIVNLLSNDVARYDKAVTFIHFYWIGPLTLLMFMALAWVELGPSCLAGFAALSILMPLQNYMGRKSGNYRFKIAKFTDQRISLMSELLNGIRVIKMYAWEKPFADMVQAVRKQEIREFRVASVYESILYGFFLVCGKLMIVCAVVAAYFTGEIGYIGSENVFVASSLFNDLKLTVGLFLPFAIRYYTEYSITCERIEKFLLLNEQTTDEKRKSKPSVINNAVKETTGSNDSERKINDQCSVMMQNYSAKWVDDAEENVLSDINFCVKPGQLLMIVGPVGCGKSSILQCLCGDAPSTNAGTCVVRGRCVYVPQQAWIFPGSIRHNVVFGGPVQFDQTAYDSAMQACALAKDTENFENRDSTIIGDRGAALSGGQKARIGLARAVYHDADVYLLDDPLSAIDRTVGKLIFEKCIQGMLKNKTVILVTNQLQYLKYADNIVVLKEGKTVATGTFDELAILGDKFTSILRDSEETEEKSDEPPETPSAKNSLVRRRKISEENTELNNDLRAYDCVISHTVVREEQEISDDEEVVEVKKEEKKDKAGMFGPNETSAEGSLKLSIFTSYFFAMGNWFVVFLIVFFCLVVQLMFNFTDWWLKIWSNKEETYKMARKIILVNSTENFPQCLIATNLPLNNDTELHMMVDFDPDPYFDIFVWSNLVLVVVSILRAVALRLLLFRSSLKLHASMFNSVLRTYVLFFDTNSVGRILNRFSKDTGAMDELLSFVVFDTFLGFLNIFAIIFMIGMMNPWVLLITAPLFVLLVFLRFYYMKTAREIKRLEGTTKSPVYSHLSSTLNGLSCIRSMHAQKVVTDDFHRLQNMHTSMFYSSLSISRWFSIAVDTICAIFIASVALINVWLSADQSAGSVGLSLFYAMSLMSFLQWITRQTTELESLMISAERILEYSDLPSEHSDDEKIPSQIMIMPPKKWPENGRITFDNVKLRYGPDSDYVLKNLSFTVEDCEKVGIVGRTGAGKSSILNALFRLSKLEGRIKIDGIDTQKIDLYELRKKICIIPQDPVLFIGTLRQNMDPFIEYTDKDIWRALELVELKTSFDDSTGGLQANIQEGGSNLSVGQRQLICLARAFLRRSKILVIDEATANVDLHTDLLIQKTIREQFAKCTVLTIAHRLNTIMDSTTIMVMDGGRLVESGSPNDLLKRQDGHFAKLAFGNES